MLNNPVPLQVSFRQLLLLAFVLIALLLGAVSLSGLHTLQGLLAQSRSTTEQAVGLNLATQGLAERSVGLERAARQYLVLQDEAMRRSFDLQANEAQQALQPLLQWPDTQVQANRWLAALIRVRTLIADTRLSRTAREQSIAAEFDELDALGTALSAHVQRGVAKRNQALQQALEHKRAQLVRQVLAAIAVAALAALAFGVWLTRPLRQLQQAIVGLGENRWQTPVDISGPADLRALGQQLDWLRLRLGELEADKARFLRHISHELKTPLAALREGVALLQDEVAGSLSADQREVTTILAQNTATLQRQIEDLLSFNAAAFEVRRLTRRPTDLRALIQETIDTQRLQWQARRLQMTVEGGPVNVPVDGQKLGMALANLLSNAIRFSTPGGVIRWRLGLGDNEVFVQVSDAGPGVAEGDRGRVFEPFFRGSRQPEGAIPGTGVGLSIVQEVVWAHGGRVRLLDEGPGATFRIELPYVH